jgi:hypothetical protein
MADTCRYVKTNGSRCGAIALSGQDFCFWHNKLHRHHSEAAVTARRYYCSDNDVSHRKKDKLADQYFSGSRPNGPLSEELPPLEDPESIQLAISILVASLADSRIEPKRAALMLYGLQIASSNVRHIKPALEDSVEHIALNQFGLEIAALENPGQEQAGHLVSPDKSVASESSNAPANIEKEHSELEAEVAESLRTHASSATETNIRDTSFVTNPAPSEDLFF